MGIIGIGNLNTSNVISMVGVFSGNTIFNEPLNWNTANVTDMTDMFNGATSFNQDSIAYFDFSKVEKIDNFIVDTGYTPADIVNIIAPLKENPTLKNNTALSRVVVNSVTNFVKSTFIFDISTNVWIDSSNSSGIKFPLINNGDSFKVATNDIVDNGNGITTIFCSWVLFDGSFNTDGLSFNKIIVPYGNDPSIIIRQFQGVPLINMDSSANASFYKFKGSITATDVPTLPYTNLTSCFQDASCTNYGNIGEWNVSNITTMNNTFNGASIYNPYIGNWNFSNVTSISNFISNTKYYLNNILIFLINLSNNTNIQNPLILGNIPQYPALNNELSINLLNKNITFSHNDVYNKITSWNTSNVTNMESVFNGAVKFNTPLTNWNTAKVKSMKSMFNGATSFNQTSIAYFDFSSVLFIDKMISNTAFNKNDLTNMVTILNKNPSLVNNSPLSKIVTEIFSSSAGFIFVFEILTSVWNDCSNNFGIKYPLINNGNSFGSIKTNITYENNIAIINCSWNSYTKIQNYSTDGLSFNINDVPYGNHPSIKIRRFDQVPLRNMDSSANASFYKFKGQITTDDVPTLPYTNLTSCFQDASCSVYGNIGLWDVSNIQIMDNTFNGASINDISLGTWDYSNVTSMNNFIANSGYNLNSIYSFFTNLSTNTYFNNKSLGIIPAYRPSQLSSLNSELTSKGITFTSNTFYSDIMAKTYIYLVNTLLYTSTVLRNKGYFASELKTLGYSVAELVDAGYTSSDFKDALYKVYDLYYMYVLFNGQTISIPTIEIK